MSFNCGEDRPIFLAGLSVKHVFMKFLRGDWINEDRIGVLHIWTRMMNLEYEKKVQLQPHIVYIAFPATLKWV